ncbi:nuclear transport factor 2 family protein [Amycolatopsis alkalitolerans]|uniref:nuclear transport factor 2 family protein n=1 Tax=Amycolatopsis alkalitolerans TaxID=2547244 RepID=UPI002E132258
MLRLAHTQHLIGSLHVTVDGDTAQCTSYVQATHFSAAGDTWTTGGRYDDSMVRTPDGWRIAERRFTRQWRHGPEGFSLRFLAN